MWKAGKLIKQIMKAYENCDLYVKRPYLRCIYNAEIMRKTYHAENLQCGKLTMRKTYKTNYESI